MKLKFLHINKVLKLHRDQIRRYGGSDGLRDRGLLESAIAMPRAQFGGQFLHEDIYEMAAAYLYHITLNHPFVDGNKRAGAAAALTFLAVNGIEVEVDDDSFTELVLNVAQGMTDKPTIAAFLREHSRPI